MTEKGLPCELCHQDRLRRWREALVVNEGKAKDWPAPLAPRFANAETLERHRRRVHSEAR